MLNPQINSFNLTTKDYERYAKHIIMDEFNLIGQQRIKLASIICIGAGGLNSTALIYLTSCGVGRIGIVDNDKIEISNLQRQILYKTSNLNNKKVEEAKKNLKDINPNVQIDAYDLSINLNNIKNIIDSYDIVIDGTDNFTSRHIISRFCKQEHKIHIYGAIEKYRGYVSVFNYQNGPSYYELYSNILTYKYETCPNTGVLNTMAGLIGIIQATETIKIITGIGTVLSGYLLHINLLEMSFEKLRIKPTKKYLNKVALHDTNTSLINSISQLNDEVYFLIDVRNPNELTSSIFQYIINIPMQVLKSFQQIEYIKRLAKHKTIVIYCKNRRRSFLSSQILSYHQIIHELM